MVGIGMVLIGLSLLGVFSGGGGAVRDALAAVDLRLCRPGPQAANQLGWFTAEVGRQPWIVYGLMRTTAAVSPR